MGWRATLARHAVAKRSGIEAAQGDAELIDVETGPRSGERVEQDPALCRSQRVEVLDRPPIEAEAVEFVLGQAREGEIRWGRAAGSLVMAMHSEGIECEPEEVDQSFDGRAVETVSAIAEAQGDRSLALVAVDHEFGAQRSGGIRRQPHRLGVERKQGPRIDIGDGAEVIEGHLRPWQRGQALTFGP